MKKKGQAAMEFLMTYGWAILVVLAAIAALAYFGVLSPQKLLPERTTFTAPIPNVDNALIDNSSYSVEIAFKNNVGVAITLNGAAAVLTGDMIVSTGIPACTAVAVSGTTTTGTAITNTTLIQNGDGFRVKWTCTGTGSGIGTKFKTDSIYFEYVNSETGQVRKASGSVDGKFS